MATDVLFFFLTAKHTFFLVQYLCCRQSWKIKAHVLLYVLLSVCTYLSFDLKPSKRMQQCHIEMYPIKMNNNIVCKGFCDQPPPKGSRSLNPVMAVYVKGNFSWYSDKVVAKSNIGFSPLDITTLTVAISLHKGRNWKSLNTRLLFMYWRKSVIALPVAKA